MADGKARIEKFDGKDFGFWRMQIEDLLYQKDLYLPLSKKPESMKDDEWKVLDRQALGVVRLTLARNVAYNVVNQKTTAGLLGALANMYEKPSAMNKVEYALSLGRNRTMQTRFPFQTTRLRGYSL